MTIDEAVKLLHEKAVDWLEEIILLLPNLLGAILIVLAAYFLAGKMKSLMRKAMPRLIDNQALINFLGTLTYFAVIVGGLLLAMRVLALDQAVLSLLAGIGIVGIALGFAFQDIAANFIAGTALVFRKNYPFKVNDIIETNDHFGSVQAINLRDTMIRTFDGKYIFIPNKLIFENAVINYSTEGRRRVALGVGVSYGEDLARVKEITIETLGSHPQLLEKKPIELFYEEFGGSSINFQVRFWITFTTPKDYLAAQSEAIMRIKEAYDRHGIVIPFPIRTLDFGIKGGEKLYEMLGKDEQQNGLE